MFLYAGFLLNSTILPDNHPVIDELSKKLISMTDMIKENDSLKPVSNELNCVKSYMALVRTFVGSLALLYLETWL